uniref:Uncharacterized protein n=1 Tax=Pseudocodium devriesii TaxID=453070 RepID=A0A386B129_9CHLO|nr:hypothetical protein [Pseudocodium devriesii]AYC65397.1 hypothetical protein [Pseudocodium devriesii]
MVQAYWKSKFHNFPIFASYDEKNKNYFSMTSLGGRIKRDSKLNTEKVSFQKIQYFKTECANFSTTGVEILSEVWPKLSQECFCYARVVMVVHDEIVVETSKDNVVSQIRKIEKEVGDKYVPLVGLIGLIGLNFDISELLQIWIK